MNADEKKATIKALTECPCSGFGAASVKTLEAMPDEALSALKAAADKTAAELKAANDAKAAADAAKTKAEADLKAAQERKITVEDLPAEMRSLVERAKAQETARKDQLVAALKDAQSVYDEARLKAMGVEQLEEVAALAQVARPAEPARDFSGRGLPAARHNAGAEDVYRNPPDPYMKALEAKKKAQTVN